MTTLLKVALALAGLAGSALPAFADTSGPVPAGPTQPPQQRLTCQDFLDHSNGMWSPTHPITLGGASIGPGVSFGSGASFSGVPLGRLLNEQCHGISPAG